MEEPKPIERRCITWIEGKRALVPRFRRGKVPLVAIIDGGQGRMSLRKYIVELQRSDGGLCRFGHASFGRLGRREPHHEMAVRDSGQRTSECRIEPHRSFKAIE